MSGSEELSPKASHLPGLDGLRAFCVLLVFLGHASWTDGYPIWLRDGLNALPDSVGVFGVQIFFVISGFLITSILIREPSISWVSIRRFYYRRALRILPPAYAYLLFLAILGHFTEFNLGKMDLLGSVFFFRHLVGLNDCLHHFWSLSIEEQFYLVFPIMLICSGRYRVYVTVVLMLIQPFLRWLANSVGSEEVVWFVSRAVRFDSILFGCLLAQTWQNRWVRRIGDEFGSQTLVGATFMIVTTFSWNYLTRDTGGNPEIVLLVRNLAIGATIVALICDKSSLCRPFNIRWIAWIGTISYSLYLWQQFFFWPTPRTVWFHWFPMNAVLAFIVGVAAHFLIERPCDLLRKRI